MPNRRAEQGDADDLSQVVHGGRHGRGEKVLVGLQPRHHQPADREDQDGEQVQAHQAGGESPTRLHRRSRVRSRGGPAGRRRVR